MSVRVSHASSVQILHSAGGGASDGGSEGRKQTEKYSLDGFAFQNHPASLLKELSTSPSSVTNIRVKEPKELRSDASKTKLSEIEPGEGTTFADLLELEPPLGVDGSSDSIEEDWDDCYRNVKGAPYRMLHVMTCTELMDKISGRDHDKALDKYEILEKVFPPRIVEINGKRWLLNVSKEQANLQKRQKLFNKMENLTEIRFRNSPKFIPSMVHLIEDAFDELLRQEILETPARGVLLGNVRNAFNATIQTLEKMYELALLKAGENCYNFKTMETELEALIADEEVGISEMKKKVHNLKDLIRKTMAEYEKERNKIDREKKKEIEYLQNLVNYQKHQIEVAENLERLGKAPIKPAVQNIESVRNVETSSSISVVVPRQQ